MPIYLTGYIDEYTDRLKNYHDSILPLGMIVQPKAHREGYLRRAGLYTWVAIDNGRFTEAGRRLFRPADYHRLIGEGLERAGDHLLFATAPDEPFDWSETLRLSRPWLRRIRRMGCPAALCAHRRWMRASFGAYRVTVRLRLLPLAHRLVMPPVVLPQVRAIDQI
jgi:hypothetical protein